MMRRSLTRPGRQAAVGLATPATRIAQLQEVDAIWQGLWRDQYTAHVDERVRSQFADAYRAWEAVKQTIGSMSRLGLMDGDTGRQLGTWRERALSWRPRLLEAGAPGTTPAPPRPPRAPEPIRWEVVAICGAVVAVSYVLASGLSRLPRRLTA